MTGGIYNLGKIIGIIILAGLLIGAFILVFKLIAGAAGIIGGFFNMILGLVVIIALIVIVIWMFSYAKRHK